MRRGREEIIAAILTSVLQGATKSKIIYKAYLNYYQAEKYIEYLLRRNLITCEGKIYKITENGMDYLKTFTTIKNDNIQLNING
jgi:predicted transcriptional regulator